MSIKHFLSFCLVLLFAVLLSGCAKKMPDGMPKLYPVSIAVTQDGTPLAGATVMLRYADPSAGTWAVTGRTEADGVAKLYTNGYLGAPAGTFKVVLDKREHDGLSEEERVAEIAKLQAAQTGAVVPDALLQAGTKWSYVNPEYNDPAKTPLEVEITSSTKRLSVDGGPAVKVRAKSL